MGLFRRRPRTHREAVDKLIAEIDGLDLLKNLVFRRIWVIAAVVFLGAVSLLMFAVRQRRVEARPPAPRPPVLRPNLNRPRACAINPTLWPDPGAPREPGTAA
ncbi:MAG: hypothetical protein FJW40_07805 [Acidobacteria bacterium]|nr:hypothetical protein [Acidobacteriota bacterium]